MVKKLELCGAKRAYMVFDDNTNILKIFPNESEHLDLTLGGAPTPGTTTDVQVNGHTITANNIANILTMTDSYSADNPFVLKSDLPEIPGQSGVSSIDSLVCTLDSNNVLHITLNYHTFDTNDAESVSGSVDLSGLIGGGETLDSVANTLNGNTLTTTVTMTDGNSKSGSVDLTPIIPTPAEPITITSEDDSITIDHEGNNYDLSVNFPTPTTDTKYTFSDTDTG
jgi:hypothetical protein